MWNFSTGIALRFKFKPELKFHLHNFGMTAIFTLQFIGFFNVEIARYCGNIHFTLCFNIVFNFKMTHSICMWCVKRDI